MATLNVKNLSDDLYSKLQERAKLQHRSVAQEITVMLEAWLAQREPLSLLELRGLGKEEWTGVDAADHIEAERRAWD